MSRSHLNLDLTLNLKTPEGSLAETESTGHFALSGKLKELPARYRDDGLSAVAKAIGRSVKSSICDY